MWSAENWLGDMAWKPDSSTNDDVDLDDDEHDDIDGDDVDLDDDEHDDVDSEDVDLGVDLHDYFYGDEIDLDVNSELVNKGVPASYFVSTHTWGATI